MSQWETHRCINDCCSPFRGGSAIVPAVLESMYMGAPNELSTCYLSKMSAHLNLQPVYSYLYYHHIIIILDIFLFYSAA